MESVHVPTDTVFALKRISKPWALAVSKGHQEGGFYNQINQQWLHQWFQTKMVDSVLMQGLEHPGGMSGTVLTLNRPTCGLSCDHF